MTNSQKVYQAGNTIRLECTFHDFDGQLIDPPLISVRIYDLKYKLLSTTSIGNLNRTSKGQYFYDYVSPVQGGVVWYEWYAEVGGFPSLRREQLKTSFVGLF